MRHRLQGLPRGQLIGLGVGSAVIVVLVVVVLVAALTGGGTKAGGHSSTTTTSPTGSSTTTTRPHSTLVAKNCPLTGVPAPGGKIPQRPALAVKIGNDPASRPQSGLDNADIVYEEMAEGGITRYLAVFQCQSAPLIGPIRSVRWDDWHVLQQYGHAILAYSGGISYWMQAAASLSWIYNANGSIYPTANAYYRYASDTPPANQGPPYNYYSSTSALWALFPKVKAPPPQLFKFSKILPKEAKPDSSASIDFSGSSPVVWQWSATLRKWLRFYDTQPDTDPSGHQFQATDVVIQIVPTEKGPYNESGPDSPDVESLMTGTGTAYVLRDGSIETGTWSRPTGFAITKFTFPNGKPMRLQPGNVWYEIVPNYVPVSFTK
ncbi:MAG: DUF3048 domain-containing protein [Acidimicrobiales bacterium]|jgi:hypothetical protein